MTSVVNQKFALKPVVAALALATAAGSAIAAPTPNQMPGWGTVAEISLGSAGTSQGGVGTPLVNLVSGGGIGVDGKVVLRWGGVGAPVDMINPHGFNLGANATMYFGAISPGSAVLNIDSSGNPSQIFGNLISTAGPIAAVAPLLACGACAFAPAIFVANGNGIVVGAGARIVAPTGVGLIGANMDTGTSINEFIANNTWLMPAAPALGTSFISYGASQVSAKSNVEIAGAINGDFVMNTPAQYVLLAGNDVTVMNTGNVFGKNISIFAGLVATDALTNVAGLSNQTVNRLWNVDTGLMSVVPDVDTYAGSMTKTGGTGNIINEGSLSAAGTVPNEWILAQAAGNIRSGILGDMDVLRGFFSDQGGFLESYSDTSTVEVYNVVSGYTTNKVLPFFSVNFFAANNSGFRSDVVINAITPGVQPSSIVTTDEASIFPPTDASVIVYGGNITIDSTINHQPNPPGVAGPWDLLINGSKSVTINADVGAGDDVRVTSKGPLVISGNVLANTDGDASGGVYIANTLAGASTTISGIVVAPGTSTDGINITTLGPTTISGNMGSNYDINITNNGTGAGNFTDISSSVILAVNDINVTQALSPANAPITISGGMLALDDINVYNFGTSAGNTTTISGALVASDNINILHYGLFTGSLTVSGSLSAGTDVNMLSDGNATLGGMGITAGDDIIAVVGGTMLNIDGPWTAGDYTNITFPLALAKLNPAGVITSPTISLLGLSFQGVNSSWMPYVDASEKPANQLVTNTLLAVLGGSMNAPIAGNTNWLLNSMDIAPLFTLAPVVVSVSAVGGTFQAVNLQVLGDMLANSGTTTTPFIGVPLTTGGFPAGGLQGNLGSQLILQSTGYMQVLGSPTLSLFGPPLAFQWPGGAVFKAGTTLQTFAPIYNAWSTNSPPYGGLFFEAPVISLWSYLAVSGTAWANFSSQPVTGDPNVYQIRKLSDTAFGFEATSAFVKNAYSNSVTGGFVCSQLGPTTWVDCP